jgi:hypothetical protein
MAQAELFAQVFQGCQHMGEVHLVGWAEVGVAPLTGVREGMAMVKTAAVAVGKVGAGGTLMRQSGPFPGSETELLAPVEETGERVIS